MILALQLYKSKRLLLFVLLPILLTAMLARSTVLASALQDSEDKIILTSLNFTSAPLVGEAAELVFTVASDTSAVVTSQINLPDGLDLVSGNVIEQIVLPAGSVGEHKLVVIAANEGEYLITALIDGAARDGDAIKSYAHLYLSTTPEMASIAEIPIAIPKQDAFVVEPDPAQVDGVGTLQSAGQFGTSAIPDEAILEPSADRVGFEVSQQGARQEFALQLENQVGVVTVDEQTYRAPTQQADFAVQSAQEEILAVDEQRNVVLLDTGLETEPQESDTFVVQPASDDDNILAIEAGSGVVTLDTDTPDVPEVTGQIGIQPSGDGILADDETNFITLDRDSSEEPEIAFGIGVREAIDNEELVADAVPGVETVGDGTSVMPQEIAGGRKPLSNAPLAAPDLIVEDIWSTTNPLVANEWENVTFRIKNNGDQNANQTFYTQMWVNSSIIGTWYTTGLGAGYTSTGSLNLKVTAPGNYQISVQVDIYNDVGESNEGNNLRSETWTWASSGAPDLVVDDIWSTTNPLMVGDWENITFRIKNNGTVAATDLFYTRMWVADVIVGTWQANSLNAGSTATGTVNVRVGSPGSYEVRAEVDLTDTVNESDESNNVRTETWAWTSPSQPDLIVDDIWSTTGPLNTDVWENITFRIKNNGNADATTRFYIRMWFDGTPIRTWYTDRLNAGSSGTGSLYIKVATAGAYEIAVVVDAYGHVAESNENNNTRTETWTWVTPAQADLIVEDIWSTTGPLNTDVWENMTFRIKNNGNADVTTRFYTRMWFDGTPIRTWYTDQLDAGSSGTGSLYIKVFAAGAHEIAVLADAYGHIAESNENNNTRTETWTWTAPVLPDLIVEDIWSTTGPLNTDVWENITFQIRNNGNADVTTRFHTRMWFDGTPIRMWFTDQLMVGEWATGSLYIKVFVPGLKNIQVMTDVFYAISESNEANNMRQEVWQWN